MLESIAPFGERRPYGLLLFLALMLLEYVWLRHRGRQVYDLRESAASSAIAAGNLLLRPLTALLVLPLLDFAASHRAWDLPVTGAGSFLLLFVAVDFAYYWFHRASHSVRWLWATHSVHHSTTRFNLSAAYRLGWTDLLSGSWLFILALVWLGTPPLATAAAFALNLLFQFFLHTEAVGRLGWLEYLFNTPSHHRVHHACDAHLLDRNFGGVFIVWDRCFGTCAEAAAGEPLHYGLSDGAPRYNPLSIAFAEWRRLGRDMWQARGPLAALRVALSRPGQATPTGSITATQQLKRRTERVASARSQRAR